jgi:thioredoxin-related protein
MARLNKGKIVFAKADTSGLLGKELGRYLRVESVPSFVFFSKGKRVGKPLGITKLPSPKLQAKVDKLAMNGDLDEDDDEEDADDT